jgi:MoxR-like ATPase
MRGKSHNILLTGPAGCGKSEFVREIAKRNGFGKVFQVNGRDDMDSSDFFGEKTVVVDPVSKQNYIEFKKGPLYQAFIEGTEVDENGDQILYDDNGNRVYDESGNPKIVGKPAVFFLDEFAALIPSVFLSVFNRAMEIPRKNGASRIIEISADGGKIVKSHPNLVMFLAGNTVGKGTESDSQMGYTAQNNQMDDSTLDRITAFYKFGYNMDAEKNIASTKLNDDKLVSDLCRFRSEIRKQWVNGNVETLLSTRALVQICDLATSFRTMKKDFLPLAIYRSVFSGLRERECPAWNETIRMVFGVDVLCKYGNRSNNKKMFFVEKI